MHHVSNDLKVIESSFVDGSDGMVYGFNNLWDNSVATWHFFSFFAVRSRNLLYLELSPCNYDLIPKKKEPLYGIRYRNVSEIHKTLDPFIRTINRTGIASGILRPLHRL
ncbi:hypothetical protein AVEN_246947-1 [Araneus ventricosus]|uniref:Uncharacterized protein n=1 Tax=Araneus ventricosus TaxID=182803 RepID=A0A4Y2U8I3_ARAVE|nr:hypothetical protein AVEN_246947-1 [Araneus ventricosus]